MDHTSESIRAPLDLAHERTLDSDPGPWKELTSHRDDVTLLGAYGDVVVGWPEVSACSLRPGARATPAASRRRASTSPRGSTGTSPVSSTSSTTARGSSATTSR